MANSLKHADLRELKPRIVVMGVGGAGGNALNNMVAGGLEGVEFIAANTDAQALLTSKAETVIQIGMQLTEGLGAGSRAEIGAAAAEEAVDDIREKLAGAHMVFVTAGMGGGTGSGAAPVISRIARELGILTVGVVTKPFNFEGSTRMKTAEKAVARLRENVDTLIVIPNQNLFRVANEDTTFADAFVMADKVLHSGIACITDLMVKEGLINLDFADVKIVMSNMGKSMMGSGIASGENRGKEAALIAITNPLLDDVTLEGAKGVLISIIGGKDLTLFEVEQAAETVREVVDKDANIIVGATFDESRKDDVLVSVLATGLGGQTNAATGIANTPLSAPAFFPTETKDDEGAAIPKFVPQPDMQLEYDGANDAILGDTAGESVQATKNTTEEGWKDDGGVTIQPIKPKNNTEGISAIVAEKAHKVEEVETNNNASFAAAPVKNPPKSSPKMPALEDFSPLAQQAVAAQKTDSKTNETVPASLFGRLSALGKKRPKMEDKIEPTMSLKKADTTSDIQDLKSDETPLKMEDKAEDVTPKDLSITAEEAMEIPSFFKRKA